MPASLKRALPIKSTVVDMHTVECALKRSKLTRNHVHVAILKILTSLKTKD